MRWDNHIWMCMYKHTLWDPMSLCVCMCVCACVCVCDCISTRAWMCVVFCMSPCIHVCHHVHTFVFATHLPVLDSVPVRAPCQNKRLRPVQPDMWTICLCRLTCVCVSVYYCVCVFGYVCKPRRSLSPGPNLGLNRGDIRFLSPPHMCVSASMAVIETVGILCVCVCVCVCFMRMARLCVRVMTGDTSPVGKKTASRPRRTCDTLFPFCP